MDAGSIKQDVERLISKAAFARKRDESQRARQDAAGYSDKVNPDFIKAPAVARHEETVLGLLLLYPEHRKAVFEGGLLSDGDFITSLNKRIFDYLRSAYLERGDSHADLNENFSEDEMGRITKMKIARMQLTENGDAVLTESIEMLKRSINKTETKKTNTLEALNALLSRKRNG